MFVGLVVAVLRHISSVRTQLKISETRWIVHEDSFQLWPFKSGVLCIKLPSGGWDSDLSCLCGLPVGTALEANFCKYLFHAFLAHSNCSRRSLKIKFRLSPSRFAYHSFQILSLFRFFFDGILPCLQSCDFSFDNPKEANERGFNFDPLKVSHFLINHRPREAGVVLNRSFLVRHALELFWRCVLPSLRVPEKTLAGFTAHVCQYFEPAIGAKETGCDRVTLSFSIESFGVALVHSKTRPLTFQTFHFGERSQKVVVSDAFLLVDIQEFCFCENLYANRHSLVTGSST